ncbi:MAG: alpha/beta hydrolase [Asgard group archaeon]|nr:alpha/beta hydrolase [Asgard group archaeon]
MKQNNMTNNNKPQMKKLDNFIMSYKRDVPNFYDENESKIIYVPVKGGEIKIYHHKPDIVNAKRPIIFIPGFGMAPLMWREFHHTHHGKIEYIHIESRDKKSAKIKRNRTADLTIDRFAYDIVNVIDYLGLTSKDYVLMGSCLSGGVILHGLIQKYMNPPTVIVFDPFCKWAQYRFLVKFIIPFVPPFLLNIMKHLIARFIMRKMKNEAQIERNKAMLEDAVAWKWRKFPLQNHKFDLTNDFKKIESEVFVFHGPKDKFHPDGTFREIAKQIPNGRFFFMKTSDHLRETLAGVIATEFAKTTKEDGVPITLKPYEIDLMRD